MKELMEKSDLRSVPRWPQGDGRLFRGLHRGEGQTDSAVTDGELFAETWTHLGNRTT